MKKWFICLFCLTLLCPILALAAVPDELIHEAVLTMTWPDDNGECWVEGHVVLGEADKGDTTEVYVQAFYENYGFMDGVFTGTGGGSIGPRTLIFENTADGYLLREILEPEDGTEYVPSIRRMMPESCIHEMNKDSGAMRAEMVRQMHEQAQNYLDSIGRTEPVQDWRERDLQLPGMLVTASNMTVDFSPPYPLWLTNTERVEDGVRYVYTRKWEPDRNSPDGFTYIAADGTKNHVEGQTGVATLQKIHWGTGEVVESISIRVRLYELEVAFHDSYGETVYTFDYDGKTYHRPEIRKTGDCRISYPAFEIHAMDLPAPVERTHETTAEIREENGQRVLVITSQHPNGTVSVTECPGALRRQSALPQVEAHERYIRLIYEDRSDDFWMDDAGVWQFTQSVISPSEPGQIYYNVYRNGNDQALRLSFYEVRPDSTWDADVINFPLLLMEDDFDLTAEEIDVENLPRRREGVITQERAQLYVDRYLPEGLTAASACMGANGIGLLADDAQGKRFLYVLREAGEGFEVIPGGEVPAQACWDDFHSGGVLNLDLYGPESMYVYLSLRPDGRTWGVTFIGGVEWFSVDSYRVGEEYDRHYYGTHPWYSLETADLTALPRTLDEARAQMDESTVAVVCNPDPKDRLYLRHWPDRNSKSFGKYYNGTIVRVWEEQDGWVRVSIGSREGWMMKQYLAFGDDMYKVDPAFPSLALRDELLPSGVIVTDEPDGIIKAVLRSDPGRMTIIGVTEDGWYHVLFESIGLEGYVQQSCFWEGRG